MASEKKTIEIPVPSQVGKLVKKMRDLEKVEIVKFADAIITVTTKTSERHGGHLRHHPASIGWLEADEWEIARPFIKKVILEGFYIDSYPHVSWFIDIGLELELNSCPVWTELKNEFDQLVKKAGKELTVKGMTFL